MLSQEVVVIKSKNTETRKTVSIELEAQSEKRKTTRLLTTLQEWWKANYETEVSTGQDKTCPVQDRTQDRFLKIHVALDRAGSETWTGQVGVHMPWRFCRAKVCVLKEEIFDFSNIFYWNNNHCTWRCEIVNEFAICLCDEATSSHKNIREKKNNNGR